MPTFASQLTGKTPRERAILKAGWMHGAANAAAAGKSYTWADGDLTITVSKPKLLTGGFQVWVEATRGGAAVPINNPLRFWNPPICVVEGGVAREDVIKTLKAIIADAVRGV